jgi:hypothetical protein
VFTNTGVPSTTRKSPPAVLFSRATHTYHPYRFGVPWHGADVTASSLWPCHINAMMDLSSSELLMLNPRLLLTRTIGVTTRCWILPSDALTAHGVESTSWFEISPLPISMGVVGIAA